MKAVTNILFACFLAVACTAREAWSQPSGQSFDLRLLDAPHAVHTDAGTQVFQELHLTNFAQAPLRLSRVDVVDAGDGRILATFTGEALQRRFALIGTSAAAHDLVVPPGRHGVVYIEWPAQGRHPRMIGHVVTYMAPPDAAALVVRGARATMSYAGGVALGPPLRGGPWVAIHGADWAKGHRRVFNAVDGAARIPGRFAVDWMRVDASGHLAHGDRDVPRNWLGYGADVLAVADATVAAVHDGMAEAASVSGNPRHTLAEDAGNYVAIRLDDGRYAFYEHLRPGSVAVRPGQRVHQGAVLGALGFTGASTGPHLHFHVADGPSPIGSEGLPFAFDAFDLLGSYGELGRLDKAGWTSRRAGEAERRLDEWPAENAVVRFPD
ncbi:MAG TPA: M23 family metallopeptidase [Rhodanobacter sp.]|nr:M23 family metallopeptidase [Rhodanobacter sp.]